MPTKPFIAKKHSPYKPEKGEYVGPRYTGINNVISDDPAAPQSGQDTYKYLPLSKHYMVESSIDLLISATFWTGFSIIPQNDYEKFPKFEKLDKKIMDSIHFQINNMQNESFENILKSILFRSLNFGFAIDEKVWDKINNVQIMTKIKSKPSYQFDIWTDEVDNIEKLEHTDSGVIVEGSKLEKFVISTYPYLQEGNYYGKSVLHSLIRIIRILNVLEEAQAKGSQLLSVRPIIHYFDQEQSDAEKSKVQTAISNIQSASVLSFEMTPNVDDPDKPFKRDMIEVIEDRASDKGVEQMKDMIELYQRLIPRKLGIPDDVGMASTNFGSFAKTSKTMSMFMSTVVRNQKFVEATTNRNILPGMYKYNYQTLPNEYKPPQFKFNIVEDEHLSEMTEVFTKLVDKQILNPKAPFILERLGLPADEKQEEIIDEGVTPDERQDDNEGDTQLPDSE